MTPTIIVLLVVIAAMLLVAITIFIALFRSQRQRQMLTKTTDFSAEQNVKTDKAKDDYYIQIAQIKKLLNQNPEAFESREQLGDCFINVGNNQSALTEYMTVLDRKPGMTPQDKIRIMNKVGNTYILLGNYSEARKYCRLVRQIDPKDLNATVNLALTILKTEDPLKGLMLLKKLHQQNPTDARIAKYMGIANYLNKNYSAAVSCFTFSDKITPLDAESLFYTGVSLLMIDSPQAQHYLTQAASDKTYGVESHYFLGKFFRNKNDFKQSNHHLGAAAANPNIKSALYLDAYYTMGLNYSEMKDIPNAVRCWQTVAAKKADYKDVAQKLQVMSSRNSSDNMKIFIAGTPTQFADLCQRFAKFYAVTNTSLNDAQFNVERAYNGDAGYFVTGECQSDDGKESYIFLFIRETGTVGDVYVRSVYKLMKDSKIDKAVCVTCGTFSDVAKDFVSARMIVLLDNDDSNSIMQKI
ncbi:MAG: restriction endonuclease [Spirochaetales bacterium]|nr:restriction endonuclease [Spirochaetales bacterium]